MQTRYHSDLRSEMFAPDRHHPLRETYWRLFENSEVGILIATDRALYVDVNRAACRLFNRSRSEMIGHHLSDFIEGARAAEVDVQWRAFLRDGAQQGVFAIQLPDRSSRLIEFNAQANFETGLHCSFVTAAPDRGNSPDKQEPLTICAWTKRVRFEGEWLPLERYLNRVHGIAVNHGICPEAFSALNWEP